MKVLALDPATSCGFAHGDTSEPLPVMGTWVLGTSKEIAEWGKNRMRRRSDPRVTRLFSRVWGLLGTLGIAILIFEDVQFSSSTAQTQLWSSYRGAIWCAASLHPNVSVECVPTGTLKKFATGHGGATKEMMAASLFQLSPSLRSGNLTDDAIDAIWLWKWAAQHLTG